MKFESGKNTSEFKKLSFWIFMCCVFVLSQTVYIGFCLFQKIDYPYWISIITCGLVLFWVGYVAIEYSKERLAYKVHCFARGIKREDAIEQEQSNLQNPKEPRPHWIKREHNPESY